MNDISEIDRKIDKLLKKIDFPFHMKGYEYVKEAIFIAIRTPEIINEKEAVLYTKVANNCQTTPPRVERAIRHAIEFTWYIGNINILNLYFGNNIGGDKEIPTNRDFIYVLLSRIKKEN